MPKKRSRTGKALRVVAGNQGAEFVSRRGLEDRIAPVGSSSTAGVPGNRSLSLSDIEWEAVAVRLAFSTRESQIARLVLDDATQTEVAARLSISPKTVHSHVERLYRKLGIHSRHQLLVRIVNAHLSALAPKR